MDPVKLESLTVSTVNFVSCLIVLGKEPVREFDPKDNAVKPVRDPILLGTVPFNEFDPRDNDDSPVRDPIDVGIVPVR